jgi:hypothetical protein
MSLSDTQLDLVRQDIWGMTQQFLDARRRKAVDGKNWTGE